MWSGGTPKRNSVRPAGKRAKGLSCQTAKVPSCHIQCVSGSCFIHIWQSGNWLNYYICFYQYLPIKKKVLLFCICLDWLSMISKFLPNFLSSFHSNRLFFFCWFLNHFLQVIIFARNNMNMNVIISMNAFIYSIFCINHLFCPQGLPH